MNTQVELRNKAHSIASDARLLLDTATDENRSDVEAKFDRMMVDADALEARAKRMDQADAFTSAYEVEDERRSREERTIKPEDRAEAESEEFRAYMRGERRAQSTLVPADGGYLIPKMFGNRIIETLVDFGPMLDPTLIDMITTGNGTEVPYPTFDPSQGVAVKIAENTKAGEDTVKFDERTIAVSKWTSKTFRVSNELLTDSVFDVPSLIGKAVGTRFGVGVNDDFTNSETGIATLAGVGHTAAAVNAVTGDELIDLIHSLSRPYRRNAKLQMNDQTLKAVRKLKDGNGQYLWTRGLNAGESGDILGHSIVINPALPNMVAGAKPILFADHKQYVGRQVGGFALKRLNEIYAESDQVAFVAFWRVGGNLMDLNAARALRMKAA